MKRAKHNLSHYRLTTFDQGQLIPVACMEVLPGDSFRHSSSALIRVGPHAGLVAPLMHPVMARIHHWFVPNRIVWPDWEDFITGTNDALTIPTTTVTPGADQLLDHLGVPTGSSVTVNLLPVRAYNMIWNNYYRDQDLQTEVTEDSGFIQRVCWEKDYFTTARTNPQADASTVSIPFSAGTANVRLKSTTGGSQQIRNAATHALSPLTGLSSSGTGVFVSDGGTGAKLDPNNTLETDLSTATGGINVNVLRQSLALQRFLENRNRFGSRYRDYLRYLGVRPSDGRLSEPEYLGGGKQHIAFSEVLAHAEGTNTEVGSMGGHGIAALRTRPYTRFFEESGYVLSLMSVRPRSMYMNSMHRHWLRRTKDDYWQKEYEMFGPQAVPIREVYAAHANETDIFGYVDRHREYREHPSTVSGDFRDSTSDYWHLARKFTSSPALNSTFVSCAPSDRIYGDANAPELVVMVNHHVAARRLVSKFPRF